MDKTFPRGELSSYLAHQHDLKCQHDSGAHLQIRVTTILSRSTSCFLTKTSIPWRYIKGQAYLELFFNSILLHVIISNSKILCKHGSAYCWRLAHWQICSLKRIAHTFNSLLKVKDGSSGLMEGHKENNSNNCATWPCYLLRLLDPSDGHMSMYRIQLLYKDLKHPCVVQHYFCCILMSK